MRPRRGVSELSLPRQSVLIVICSLEVDVGRNLDVLHACLEALAAGRLKTQVSCESELSTHTLLGSDPIFSVDCPVYSFTRRHFALLGTILHARDIRLFSSKTIANFILLHTAFTYAFQPGCLINHI